MKMNRLIDHTLLKANATSQEIEQLLNEALKYDFYSVCIQPAFLRMASKRLVNSSVLPITVVGFPLGANTSACKAWEAKDAVNEGAKEIDMVIAIGKVVEGGHQNYITDEIAAVVAAVKGVPVKVIIETAYLNESQIRQATQACVAAGAHFVKTSTGFASRGASLEDLAIISSELSTLAGSERVQIKASGGIKSVKDLQAFVAAGATRIGTSNGVAIVTNSTNASGIY